MTVETLRRLTEWERSAAGFLSESFREKDGCKELLNDVEASDADFARGWIEEKILIDFLRATIEDNYIPITDNNYRLIARLRDELRSLRDKTRI